MALRLPPLPTIRDLVHLYKLRALKKLSQNFLLDERLTDKIVNAAGRIRNHYICEVGPGPGSITRSILRAAPKAVVVVEKDSRFLPTLEILQEATSDVVTMNIVIGDIRSYNLEAAFNCVPVHDWNGPPPPIHIIGNLPFSVSTILLIEWLKSISERRSAWSYGRAPMTLTFQKEVAERMIAAPGERQRCRLSVMCQLWCDVEHKFTIPGRAFVPKPDVDVSVVTLCPRRRPLVGLPFELVERVVRTIFNMRQKHCRRGVELLFPIEQRDVMAPNLFRAADVDHRMRPFELSNDEFVRICYAYCLLCDAHPEIVDFNFRACKKL